MRSPVESPSRSFCPSAVSRQKWLIVWARLSGPLESGLAALLIVVSLSSAAKAQDQRQKNVDSAIKSAERICLSGSRYKFDLKANGALQIFKRAPGVETGVNVDRNETRGGTFFNDEKVRRLVDQDIRACMEREWPRVGKALSEANNSAIIHPRIIVAPPHIASKSWCMGMDEMLQMPRPDHASMRQAMLENGCDHYGLGVQ